jgi:peptide subunit release factor RF-3
MARERQAIDEAFAGDVVGIVDKGTLRIGDTLLEDAPSKNAPVFGDIPRFPPEHFVRVLSADPMRRKQLDTGSSSSARRAPRRCSSPRPTRSSAAARRRSSAPSASCSST